MHRDSFLQRVVSPQTDAPLLVSNAHLKATTDQLLNSCSPGCVVLVPAQVSLVVSGFGQPQILHSVIPLVVVDVVKTRLRPRAVHHSPDHPVDDILLPAVLDVSIRFVRGLVGWKLHTGWLPSGSADQKAALVVIGKHAAEVDGGWFDIHVGILTWIRGMSIPPL